MTFTVSDFHDLVEILETQPEWRAEMRRLVLTDDVLGLPQALRDLAQTVHEWAEAQRGYEKRSEERFGRIEGDIHTLKTDVAVLKTDVAVLKTDVKRLDDRVGRLDGRSFEQQARERIPSYLSRFALRLRPISHVDLANLLEDAFEEGRISEEQMDDAKLIDLVASGRRREDKATIYLAAEASITIAQHDIERAERRAAIIATATGVETMPVIIGETISMPLRVIAEQQGVGYVVVSVE